LRRVLLPVLVLFAVLVVIAIGVFIWYLIGYNMAVQKDQAADAAWADVEAQLTRRYDLVPNLVATVKGYAEHEEKIFTELAEARKSYFAAQAPGEQIAAANRLEGVISRLLMLTENYPNLRAAETFLSLQDQLEGTENRIAVARTRYNEAVRDLNTFARSFFGRFFVAQAGVEEAQYFEAPAEVAETVPQVDFAD